MSIICGAARQTPVPGNPLSERRAGNSHDDGNNPCHSRAYRQGHRAGKDTGGAAADMSASLTAAWSKQMPIGGLWGLSLGEKTGQRPLYDP